MNTNNLHEMYGRQKTLIWLHSINSYHMMPAPVPSISIHRKKKYFLRIRRSTSRIMYI